MIDSMTNTVKILKTNPIFKNIDELTLLEIIKSNSEIKAFKRNEIISSPKKSKRQLGIIISGNANVKKGKAQMSVLNEGEIFGAVTLYANEPFAVTIVRAQVECEVLFISKEIFDILLWSDRKIMEDFLTYLTQRIIFLTSRIEALTAGASEQKLLSYLNASQKDGLIKISSIAELARKLDIGRASLYRAIDLLTNDGYILRDGNTFKLLKQPN